MGYQMDEMQPVYGDAPQPAEEQRGKQEPLDIATLPNALNFEYVCHLTLSGRGGPPATMEAAA